MDSPTKWFNFDDAYVERLRARDAATFQHCVGYFTPLLRVTLRHFLKRREDVEDVMQEVFRRVLMAADKQSIEDGRKLGSYIPGIAKRAALEFVKKRKEDQLAPGIEATRPHPALSAESEILDKERNERAKRAFRELHEDHQRVILRLVFQRQDRKHFAKEFGLTPQNVRTILHRAIRKFIATYKALGAGN